MLRAYYRLVLVLVLIIMASAFPSCRKTRGCDPPPPPPDKIYTVLNTGFVLGNDSKYHGFYWIDSTRYELECPAGYNVFTSGIQRYGGDVYVAGHIATAEDDGYVACYWKNGRIFQLPPPVPNFYSMKAKDMQWLDGTLYILGQVDLAPAVWKINGQSIDAQLVVHARPEVISAQMRCGNNLQLYNGKLYFSGTQPFRDATGKLRDLLGYWTISTDGINYTVLDESSATMKTTLWVHASSQGVFIAGNYRENPLLQKPAIWLNSNFFKPTDELMYQQHGLNKIAITKNGTMYLNIVDSRVKKPLIWKITGNAITERINPSIPANTIGDCLGIAALDDQLIWSVVYHNGQRYQAYYTLNNRTTDISLPEAEFNFMQLTDTKIVYY